MKTKTPILLLISLIGLLCVSCKQKTPATQTDEQKQIVSLSPNITETLFAIGADDLLVGVTSYCDYPVQAKEIECIGSIMEPDIEKIISLSPSLVITTGTGLQKTFESRLSTLGIRCESVEVNRLEDVFTSIETLGNLTGRSERAAELSKAIASGLFQRPKAKAGRIMAVIQREPLIAAGKDTCIDSLIRIAGGENACPESGYPVINAESLILMAPDIIIETASITDFATDEQATAYYSLWLGTAKVYLANRDVLSRPGPRVCEAVEIIENIIGDSAGAAD
ncbi:MAG: ABC transporter substrate-binding protein [Phycisphaerae bacterium]